MKILVLGADGMLGHRVCLELKRGNIFDVVGVTRQGEWSGPFYGALGELWKIEHLCLKSAKDDSAVEELIKKVSPDAVINAIGIIKQKNEAKQSLECIDLNARLPHVLSKFCREIGSRLIQISTDCVFSGMRGQYTEEDIADPIDVYGRSKLLGEVTGEGMLTLRTSIVGWELKGYRGLFEWFACQRDRSISGYAGAIYSGVTTPVLGRLIAWILIHCPNLSGLYQVSSDSISKYELLLKLAETMGWSDIIVEKDSGVRCDRSLSGKLIKEKLNWSAPSWDEMLEEQKRIWTDYVRMRSSH